MTDAKEWVTVKIEEPVRDDARDDPRTYSEIMRDGLDVAGGASDGEASGDPMGANDYTKLLDRLERIEAAASAAEERTGQIQGTLDDLGGGR